MEWYVFAFGSAVLGAISAIIEKKTLLKENPLEFSTVLALFNALISLPILFFVSWSISYSLLLLIYLVSILATIAFYLVSKALRHMNISIESPLLNFETVILVVLASLVLGEAVSKIQLAGILIIVISGYLLELPKNLNFKTPIRVFLKSKSIHMIFIAMVLYAFTSIGDKVVLGYIEPIKYILIAQVFISINFVIMISIFQNGLHSIRHGIRNAGKYVLLTAIFTTSYRLLQATATSMALISLVIPIKKLSTVISTFFGGELFHEKRVIFKSLIALVMVFGAVLIILG
ncbi:MAG: DMT family transporter [Candidatus Aenigmarchaeota archaeon]|nr:DMT family transporter [Candidatus Aenigmarchaeota archaeon]